MPNAGFINWLFEHILAKNERIQRVFDEGNRPSVAAVSDLKDAVRRRLASTQRIIVPDESHDGVIELSSATTPMLQAADLAAGYAKSLYLSPRHGLRVVCEEFKGVILNGAMVRDWSQVERSNLADLRA